MDGHSNINERGSALVYILIAIALLALLTVTFMEPSSQQTQSQNTFKTASDIKSQADFIRTTIQECVLNNFKGDKNIPGADQKNQPYPILPGSDYFDDNTADPDNISTNEVKYLRCPGNPGNNPDHAPMFSGTSGKFLPPPAPLFEDWMYYTGDDGVFIWTRTEKTDAFLQSALDKLDEEFAECEADKIDASAGDVDMDSEGTAIATCPDDSTCFRVWIKIKPTAKYQAGSDEVAAGCP